MEITIIEPEAQEAEQAEVLYIPLIRTATSYNNERGWAIPYGMRGNAVCSRKADAIDAIDRAADGQIVKAMVLKVRIPVNAAEVIKS